MAQEKDQAFVEYVAKELVEKPEAVKVSRTVDEMGVLIELSVDKDDMGVIIGKEGKTAKAIRTLLRVLGAKNDARVNLKIVEPEGSERPAAKEAPAEEQPAEAPAEEEPKDENEDDRPMADLEL
jgi:predicted RNA-binding protein YlqC (UPF0109 family)